jgi:hypothetical protein
MMVQKNFRERPGENSFQTGKFPAYKKTRREKIRANIFSIAKFLA